MNHRPKGWEPLNVCEQNLTYKSTKGSVGYQHLLKLYRLQIGPLSREHLYGFGWKTSMSWKIWGFPRYCIGKPKFLAGNNSQVGKMKDVLLHISYILMSFMHWNMVENVNRNYVIFMTPNTSTHWKLKLKFKLCKVDACCQHMYSP